MPEDTQEIIIRPFRPEDQTATQKLILAGLAEYWDRLDPTRNPDLDDIGVSYADGTFLVAWQGDELVGTGALVREAESVGRVVRMSVVAHKRRCGIGSFILQRLCERARGAGYVQLVLETTSTWEDAIAFYESHGFRPVGSWDGDTHFVLELGEV